MRGVLYDRVLRPIGRWLLLPLVAGLALAEVDLVRGILAGSSSPGEKVALGIIGVVLVLLAAPVLRAARPPRR